MTRRRSRGAALPLYLFAMFVLVAAFYLLHGIGWKLAQRAQIQHAADRAAFSGAAVMARGLNLLEYTHNSLTAQRGLRAVYSGISRKYGEVRGAACSAAAANAVDNVICDRMIDRAAIRTRAARIIERNRPLDRRIEALTGLAETIVNGTPAWAADAARDVALANGATDAYVTIGVTDALPYELGGAPAMRRRVRRAAEHQYRGTQKQGWLNVAESDPTIFNHPQRRNYRDRFRREIRDRVDDSAGKYWVEQFQNDTQRRKMLAVTVFASRASEDAARLRRFNAAGAAGTADVFQQRPEVAVARAEPYFTLKRHGRPDGRAGWSARLRPVHRAGDDSRSSLATAAADGAQTKAWLADWLPAFGRGPDGSEIPH